MFVKGNVRFDLNRTGAVNSVAPVPSAPVALQDVNSGMYNETGRFMIINGDKPGTSFFRTTVDVKPDTF